MAAGLPPQSRIRSMIAVTLRHFRSLTLGAVLLQGIIGCTGAGADATADAPSRYLYVWAGTSHDSIPGTAMVTVLDANPSSADYGKILTALTVDTAGRMPHHTEFDLPEGKPLFVNDYAGNKSHLIDFSDPVKPRVVASIAPPPGMRQMHSF